MLKYAKICCANSLEKKGRSMTLNAQPMNGVHHKMKGVCFHSKKILDLLQWVTKRSSTAHVPTHQIRRRKMPSASISINMFTD